LEAVVEHEPELGELELGLSELELGVVHILFN
jgi:hypothetical protein